jgi:diaminopimelate epimerase
MTAAGLPFRKMHGLGNDFVVLDARARALGLSLDARRMVADRKRGVGCDQLIVLEPPAERDADVFMRIYNPDGSEAGACGNATRCVASVLMAERGSAAAVVQTVAGLLEAEKVGVGGNGLPVISVDMGPARLDWRDVPVSVACDTLHLPLAMGPYSDPVGCSMGNPHATFDRLRLRMWERGAGQTLACGSGACAAIVAAARRGLTARKAEIVMDGGTLTMEWLRDGHVLMTGGVAQSFTGTLDPALLA